MIYTKPWEYYLGMSMMFFGMAVVVFMTVLAIIFFLQGNMIAFLYIALGIFNAFYVGEYFQETKDYRERRRING